MSSSHKMKTLTINGVQFTLVDETVGSLSDLNTTDKSSVVAAVNEVASNTGNGSGGNSVTIDATLTQEGHAADAKAVGDAINKLSSNSSPNGDGLTTSVKTILSNIMTILKAQVEDENGTPQGYNMDISGLVTQNDTLISALGGSDNTGGGEVEPDEPVDPEVTLTSISATYSGGDVPAGTAVTDLTGIVVKAHYSDGTSKTVTGYTLSGTIAEGSNTVTVAYQGKTATFTVTGTAVAQTYTVTNNLTNVTNSNSATTASGYYSATLSAEDGYNINVTITMGGVDITDDVYTADGTILIQNVTGNIVITAVAELAESPVIYQLANTPRTVNADLYEDTGLTFGSNTANGYTKAWSICVDVVVPTNGKVLYGVNHSEANAKCLQFQTNGAGSGLIYICNNSNAQIANNEETQYRFVITHAANAGKNATVHLVKDGAVTSTEIAASYGAFNNSIYAGNLYIGGRDASSFIGTINEFAIYEGIMSDAAISEFLGVA